MQRNKMIVWMVMITFFVISFLTNIIGTLLPIATTDLHLTLAQSGIIPFAFFIAYIISIPAGYLVEKIGEKYVILIAFALSSSGSIIFTLSPSYASFLLSLFIMGAGVAMLQVSLWPLLRTAGGEENYSFNSVLAQMFFGVASFLSPMVYSYLVVNMPLNNGSNIVLDLFSYLVPSNMSWVSMYWIFGLISILMIFFTLFIKFPKVKLQKDEQLGGFKTITYLLKKPVVIIFFFGIFAYVGTEQGISVWISQFLAQYGSYDPNTTGATVIAYFWALQGIGAILGIVLLKLFDVKKILATFLILLLISFSIALFTSPKIALIAFPACGFLTSVMYGSIFSLGLNSIDSHHGTFSGIMCTGIIGGAVVPSLEGLVGNYFSLRTGMCLVYITIFFMLYIAISAKPLIKNKTIPMMDLFKKK
jgi:fucose permease